MIDHPLLPARRSFLSRLAVAAAALGVTAPAAPAQTASRGSWQPARHGQDDWLEQLPGKHRVFFDALTQQGVADAIHFAVNVFEGNKSGYGLQDSDVAIVMCLRHSATSFAFNDAMWAKYGSALSDILRFKDPKTSEAPSRNLYNAADFRSSARGVTLDALGKRGVRFAICDMATHNVSNGIAQRTDASADAVYKDLSANPVEHGRFVPAGVIAATRAQERGYSIVHVG